MQLQIPAGEFKAFVFDCDGTIADSMGLHYRAWKAELEVWGCEFSLAQHHEWAGAPTQAIIERLNRLHGLEMPVALVAAGRERRYLELIPEVRALPHVLEQVYLARDRGLKLAVGSGSRREGVFKTLDALGITSLFQAIVTAEDYKNGKPDPEVFLIAAERLGVRPGECLVFEDAELGIQAAVAAGMKWIKVV